MFIEGFTHRLETVSGPYAENAESLLRDLGTDVWPNSFEHIRKLAENVMHSAIQAELDGGQAIVLFHQTTKIINSETIENHDDVHPEAIRIADSYKQNNLPEMTDSMDRILGIKYIQMTWYTKYNPQLKN